MLKNKSKRIFISIVSTYKHKCLKQKVFCNYWFVFVLFSCTDVDDDPFRPCFACEGFEARQVYGRDYYEPIENDFISRQSGERFQTTRQSRRLVCRGGRSICRLRVDRAMQFRQRSYSESLQFIQSEQYLTSEDTDILRFFKRIDFTFP